MTNTNTQGQKREATASQSLVAGELRCEKCGSQDVHTRWHGEGSYHVSRAHQDCWGDYGPDRGKPKAEHLHYHCRNCQFGWHGPLTPASTTTTARSSPRKPSAVRAGGVTGQDEEIE